jgi:nicotinate-nucleotide adenylyltransferase
VIVAIFGGSFNPPHLSHVLGATVVLSTQKVDRLLVVPTFKHPFAKNLESYDDRVTMCEHALAWLPRVSVSRVEEELGGESLTLRTLEHLHARHPDWEMRLVIGADVLGDAHKWHRYDDVIKLAPPIVLGRANVQVDGAPTPVLPGISSTNVRALIAKGAWDDLAELVPRDVLAFIRSRGLYAAR